MTRPRAHQAEVLRFRAGRMGVAAVPGSGKTWTLTRLAVDMILEGRLRDFQEILVVTLVNSAVENFYRRMQTELQHASVLGFLGYRVRTLHGLSHDIVRERPRLAGLADDFQIADEREADELRQEAALAWIRSHPYALDDYLSDALEGYQLEKTRREHWPDLVGQIAANLIRFAKDRELPPEAMRQQLDQAPLPLPLAEMAADIYADYQRALAYRGRVDFDDLIRLALQALRADPTYLARLRERWPYILEDEAQDSSRLQEQILRLLAGERGHWVRVGDPNQAIFETFTTASPHFLLDFLREPGVQSRRLPESGRSQPAIIRLANYLVTWTRAAHPIPAVREALAEAEIIPAPEDDPRPNPPNAPGGVHLSERAFTPDAEIQAVARSLERWLPEHPDQTVAVLVPRNKRGFEIVDELRRRNLDVVDSLLQSSAHTRRTAGDLSAVLNALADPLSSGRLAEAYGAWRAVEAEDVDGAERRKRGLELLRKCRQPEDFLQPGLDRDWLADLRVDLDLHTELTAFRASLRRWQAAVLLPIDQVILTVAQDLYTARVDLAVAHKLAVTLRREAANHPRWRLPQLTDELGRVARNERRFLGFSEDDSGFDPERHRGQVVVGTLHKAKGLEWDRVYLLSVNNYDFPSGQDYDRYISEKWFVRGRLNLEAEAVAQLQTSLRGQPYQAGLASEQARLDYVRERLRLLYVAITRARRELMITWNTGRDGDCQPALPLAALTAFWKEARDESGA